MLTYLHFLRTIVDVEFSDGLRLLLLFKSVTVHHPPNHFGFLFSICFGVGVILACIFHLLFFIFLNCIERRVYKSTICARTICRLSCIQSLAPCGAKKLLLQIFGPQRSKKVSSDSNIWPLVGHKNHALYPFRQLLPALTSTNSEADPQQGQNIKRQLCFVFLESWKNQELASRSCMHHREHFAAFSMISSQFPV